MSKPGIPAGCVRDRITLGYTYRGIPILDLAFQRRWMAITPSGAEIVTCDRLCDVVHFLDRMAALAIEKRNVDAN